MLLLKQVDHCHIKSMYASSNGSHLTTLLSHLADAADHWLSYASSAKDIEKFYDTHDPLKGDAPDKEILAQVLAVANGDVPPSAEEVVLVDCLRFHADVKVKICQMRMHARSSNTLFHPLASLIFDATQVEWVLKTANVIGNGVTSKPAILMALARWCVYGMVFVHANINPRLPRRQQSDWRDSGLFGLSCINIEVP